MLYKVWRYGEGISCFLINVLPVIMSDILVVIFMLWDRSSEVVSHLDVTGRN
jgi:hypothetical protein